jgi:hypothetical protein
MPRRGPADRNERVVGARLEAVGFSDLQDALMVLPRIARIGQLRTTCLKDGDQGPALSIGESPGWKEDEDAEDEKSDDCGPDSAHEELHHRLLCSGNGCVASR